ncbi:iron reductase [Auriculariales sp. MPI-PUGE-AT-0066]|nr:iron reductase [Auriculariales sp. MPI-PUGE-AT-0066]
MADGIIVPDEFKHYDALEVDPHYARYYTYAYGGALGAAALVALPRLLTSLRARRAYTGLGLWEDNSPGYEALVAAEREKFPPSAPAQVRTGLVSVVSWLAALQLPLRGVNLDVGQVISLLAYIAVLVFCLTDGYNLSKNPDRAGFIALAHFPLIFLTATKNGMIQVLLGHGYEKLNWIHRWAGRSIFLCIVLHGSFWLATPTVLREDKRSTGLSALGLLCVLVASSLGPVRRFCYQVFFGIHVVTYTAFFILVCYHTEYAPPYIIPAVSFYAFDMFVRMLRFRIKDATLEACDQQMTIIHVPDVDGGWTAGQHVRVRVFIGGRCFESHPLTIVTAPRSITCSNSARGIILGSRVQGPWSRALNNLAREAGTDEKKVGVYSKGVHIQLMLDGPYGGCALDMARFENVLLVAGGSGITFVLGVLDDLVGRIARQGRLQGELTRRIDIAWCIRSFGCLFWFSDLMRDIADKSRQCGLQLHFNVFVTCLCNPEAVPPIPELTVTMDKPSMRAHLTPFLSPTPTDAEASASLPTNGGLGIAVCGPRGLTNEAQNTVAMLSPSQMTRLGGAELFVEHFSL